MIVHRNKTQRFLSDNENLAAVIHAAQRAIPNRVGTATPKRDDLRIEGSPVSWREEYSAANVAKVFPWMTDTIDAIATARKVDEDIRAAHNMGKVIMNKAGTQMRRYASIPIAVIKSMRVQHGVDLMFDKAARRAWLRANKDWSYDK